MNAQQYQQAKDRVTKLERKIAQLEGQLAEVMETLMEEFEVSGLTEAEDLIDELTEEEEKLNEEIASIEKKFKKKWKHVLEQIDE